MIGIGNKNMKLSSNLDSLITCVDSLFWLSVVSVVSSEITFILSTFDMCKCPE